MIKYRRLRRAARVFMLVVIATSISLVFAVVREGRSAAGSARYYGSVAAMRLSEPIVDIAALPNGDGYWMTASDGGVFTFGDARFYGSTGAMRLNRPIVGMAASPTGRGYWLVAADGGIFTFGDARFYGSTGAIHLRQPIVGMAATRTGRGYWLVAADGGIFTFGDARFRGSLGNIHLFRPIVGMAASHSGLGYWLVASDGGIFTFGDARFWGSTGGRVLNSPVVGMAGDPHSQGYWLVAQDGQVYSYGGARFLGSPGQAVSVHPVVGMDAARSGGYWMATGDGGVYSATPSGQLIGDPNLQAHTRQEAMAEDLFERINAERAARGLSMLAWDGQLANIGNGWAAHMGATNVFAHQNLPALFGIPAFASRFDAIRENIYNGSGIYNDSGSAHFAFMNSAPHRTTILTPQLQAVGVGIACVSGRLWVAEEFGTFVGNPAPGAIATPPVNPIARPSQTGPSC
jgi:hypothetical protein